MKKRLIYLAAFLILLLAECLIGAFVHDNFIRPYVGDLLVTVLLCCLGRVCFPKAPWLCPAVLLFSWGVELLQLLDLPRLSAPLFLVFVFLRKYIMSGVSRSGIKG